MQLPTNEERCSTIKGRGELSWYQRVYNFSVAEVRAAPLTYDHVIRKDAFIVCCSFHATKCVEESPNGA
jgi:hypothetical protein